MIGETFSNLQVWAISVLVTLLLMAGHEIGVQGRLALAAHPYEAPPPPGLHPMRSRRAAR